MIGTVTDAFDVLFDDAAIFPPGNAPLADAVAAHVARRETDVARFVGPFVCSADRLDELAAVVTEPVEVVLVGAGTSRNRSPLVDVVGIEMRGPVDAVDSVLPVTVEMPWGAGFVVPDGARLKLRCGGAHVPTIDELAAAIAHCVAHDQPFKLTAGLHHAVRTDREHGFVNVMAAVVAARDGADPAAVLAATSIDQLDVTTLGESRVLFTSIGTCSIAEPLCELRGLGLIA